jgi:hypothetical protein
MGKKYKRTLKESPRKVKPPINYTPGKPEGADASLEHSPCY